MKTLTADQIPALLGSKISEALSTLLRDSVFLTLLALIVAITFIDRPQLIVSLVDTAKAMWSMLPFFILAIAFAAFAKATQADGLIAKAFSGQPARATILAALVGAI
jgi:hypothetical protein